MIEPHEEQRAETQAYAELIQMLVDTLRPYGWSPRSMDGYLAALADLPLELVRYAVFAAVRTEPKMPAPADLRRVAVAQVLGEPPDPDTALAEVRRAIGTCGRNRTPEFSHPVIADTVAAIGWRQMCDSVDRTGERITFVRAFTRLAERADRDQLVQPHLDLMALVAGHRVDELEVASTGEEHERG